MLSLVVIAKDEEGRIGRCLRSVPFAAERIVLDSGSTDGTVAEAEAAGATVVRTDWPGFVAQKNRALERAAQPWVLSLDADEELSPEPADELELALRANPDVDGFSFPRCSIWLGTPLRHGRWYPDRKVRVARRGKGRWSGDDPHDRLGVDGRIARLRGDILHVPYENLSDHLATIARYSEVNATAMRARGVRGRWWDVAARPPLHFFDAYLLRQGFRDGVPGLAVASLGSTHVLCKWLRLWLDPAGGPPGG